MQALGFLIGATYLPFLPSGAFSPRWWVIMVGVAMLVVEHRRCLFRASPAHWWGLAFLGYGALTALWAYPAGLWDQANSLIQWVVMAVVFMWAAVTNDISEVWVGLGWACVLNAAIAILQIVGVPIFNPLHGSPGLFLNRDLLAEYGTLVLCALMFTEFKPERQCWYVLMVMSAVICAVLPFSRDAYLALGVVGVTILCQLFGTRGKLMVVGIAIVLLVDALWLEYTFSYARMVSMSNRLDFWAIVIANLKPFGWGFGAHYWLMPWHFAHNEYLQMIFDLGVGAALLIPMVWYCVAWKDPYHATVAERFVLLALGVECLVGFPLHAPATFFVGALCLGSLAGAHAGLRNSQRSSRGPSCSYTGSGPYGWPPVDVSTATRYRSSVSPRSKYTRVRPRVVKGVEPSAER